MRTSRKVLIITYYWPPSGGIAVHRCLKFAKYLREFGWEPIVYAPENAQYPFYDESTLKDIPEDIEIIKYPIKEPFKLFKLLSGRKKTTPLISPLHVRDKKVKFFDNIAIWIRGNFFIPDARALWIKPSVKYLSKYLSSNKIDAVFSDGPPHTNTVIACRISEKFNIPWLADFQDPWTQVDYYPLFKLTRLADRKHKLLEQESFGVARKITIASPTWKIDLENIGAKNVDVVYYGYDEDDFQNIQQKLSDDFLISHSGLMGYDRNPEFFLKVIGNLISQNREFARKFKLILAGVVDYSVKSSIQLYGLNNYVEYTGTISKTKAIELMFNSQLLLLPLNKADNNKGRIPGKFYENLRSGRPILCLGPIDGDVSNILLQTGKGKCVEYEDEKGIKEFILSNFVKFMKGGIPNHSGDVSTYSVREQTAKIAYYLDEIAG